MLSTPMLLRLARRLHAAWAEQPRNPPDRERDWCSLDFGMTQLHQIHRLWRLAVAKDLPITHTRLRSDLDNRFDDLIEQLTALRQQYSLSPTMPSLGEWVEELRHLEAEFGGIEVVSKQHTLRVTTDPIVLENVHLGPFAIDFVWSRVKESPGVRCFNIVALEPLSAAGKPNVTHPHVENEVLCPGDARVPLEQAVSAGRLVDAFLLVRAVLTNYNSGSTYVPLDEWTGETCSDCGRYTDADDSSSCERCGSGLCDECVYSCQACSTSRCRDCLETCAVCRTTCCVGCLETGVNGQSVCPECVTAPVPNIAVALSVNNTDSEAGVTPEGEENADEILVDFDLPETVPIETTAYPEESCDAA